MPITETVEYYVYAQNYQESEMESVLKRQNKQFEKNPTNTHKTKQTQKQQQQQQQQQHQQQ